MDKEQQQKKTRFIIVLYDFSEASEVAFSHGVKLCSVLKSRLCLVHFFSDKLTDEEKNTIRQKLYQKAMTFSESTNIQAEAYALEGKLSKLILPLAEKIEAVIVVAAHQNYQFAFNLSFAQLMRIVRRSRIPFLTVSDSSRLNDYNHVILPVSYTRQNKERIAWASYFHRLNKSAIHVLPALARDGNFKTGIRNNLAFLRKIFDSLEIYYKIIQSQQNIHTIDDFALDYAVEHHAAPVLILTTERPDIFDLFWGVSEKKRVFNKQHVPILLINPRDDMYVLCN